MKKFKRNINYVPALYKIFDEIIVKEIDNHTRTQQETQVFPKNGKPVMNNLEVVLIRIVVLLVYK